MSEIGYITAHGQPVPAAPPSIAAAIAGREGFNGFAVSSQQRVETAPDPGERLRVTGLIGHRQAVAEQAAPAASSVPAMYMTLGKRATGERVIRTVGEASPAGTVYTSAHALSPRAERIRQLRTEGPRYEVAGTGPGRAEGGRHQRRSFRLLSRLGDIANSALVSVFGARPETGRHQR